MNDVSLARCWRCSSEHPPSLFCPACQAIQTLSPTVDYFKVLGLPVRPVVDEAALTQRYYELSRRLHPDLYQTGSVEEKDASLKNTALLNRAYRTLRDLVQRGQYWLELQGEKLGKENNRVPPTLATLVFEVQEKLEEIRDAGAEGKAALAEVHADLEERMQGLRETLQENLQQWNGTAQSPELLAQLKRILSEIAYLRTLLRDVEKESEPPWNG